MDVDLVLTFIPLSIGLVSGYLHDSKRNRQHVISCTCVHMINVYISCMHIERG